MNQKHGVLLVSGRRTHQEGHSAAFDANDPGFEVYSDEPPFTMPEPHPLDQMGMWASNQQESNLMRKSRRTAVIQDPPGQLADVSAFTDCIENGTEPEMNVRLGGEPDGDYFGRLHIFGHPWTGQIATYGLVTQASYERKRRLIVDQPSFLRKATSSA